MRSLGKISGAKKIIPKTIVKTNVGAVIGKCIYSVIESIKLWVGCVIIHPQRAAARVI
jgi:hypothetical protein